MVTYEPRHTLRIEYCAPCNYLNLAIGLEEEFLAQWAPITKSTELIPTAWGTFEVTLDGELIFSKWALARHPKPGEISALVAARIGAPLEEYVTHAPEKFDEQGFPVH
jgi:selenoprotein W-related protein